MKKRVTIVIEEEIVKGGQGPVQATMKFFNVSPTGIGTEIAGGDMKEEDMCASFKLAAKFMRSLSPKPVLN